MIFIAVIIPQCARCVQELITFSFLMSEDWDSLAIVWQSYRFRPQEFFVFSNRRTGRCGECGVNKLHTDRALKVSFFAESTG
ncbi:MAG: hypothetical protein ACREQV_02790, partial [Candidatus Binatia bacterium]